MAGTTRVPIVGALRPHAARALAAVARAASFVSRGSRRGRPALPAVQSAPLRARRLSVPHRHLGGVPVADARSRPRCGASAMSNAATGSSASVIRSLLGVCVAPCSFRLPPRTSSSGSRCSCGCCASSRDASCDVPAFFYPARGLRGRHARLGRVLQRPARQLRRFQTARAVSDRADGLRLRPRQSKAPLVVQVIISVGAISARPRHHPVRRASIRQPRPPAAGLARTLHDLLGAGHARHLRRSRAHPVFARPHLAAADHAGAPRRPGR